MDPVRRICQVITRSSVDEVRRAFNERGITNDVILKITSPPSKATNHRRNVVLVHLDPTLPVSGIPWRVPITEPGFGLGPRKVALQGSCCAVCRSSDHQKSQCEHFKNSQCGHCGYPLKLLTEAGIDNHLHDCEGGPTGFGVEHLDLDDSAWHLIQQQHKSQQQPAALVDKYASVRSAALLAAQAAAEAVKGRKKDKRPRVPEQSGFTPEPQQQKLDNSTILPLRLEGSKPENE